MKNVVISVILIILILSNTSCSARSVIPVEETEKHYNEYLELITQYCNSTSDCKLDITSDWYNTERSGSIFLTSKYTQIYFDLYNQHPDELSPFAKADDDGYEEYSLRIIKDFKDDNDICNFENDGGKVISLILSEITSEDISVDNLENVFDSYVVSNINLNDYDLFDERVQTLYSTEGYIDDVRFSYNLNYDYSSHYSEYNCFTEEITFSRK